MSLYSPRISPSAVEATTLSTKSSTLPHSTASSSPPRTMEPLDLGYSFDHQHKQWQHLYVLPVLLMEFLAIALTRAVLPGILLKHYGSHVYLVMGCAECVRGFLAFCSCPLFGKLSDVVGRRLCLFVTVAGTCAPVCALAVLSFANQQQQQQVQQIPLEDTSTNNITEVISSAATEPDLEEESSVWPVLWDTDSTASQMDTLSPNAITIFVFLLAASGIFSSTFTLVFAYISDTVRERNERVSAYGLALATFGLSFTIGPMAGGYIARAGHTQDVFLFSFILTVLDLLYIYFVLPESNRTSISQAEPLQMSSWWSSPWETLAIIAIDPFLRRVSKVAFLYYTSLWAVISTLVLYAAKRFAFGPERLGELMSALGLSTMLAEAVLVRILVPILGEKKSMRLGLASFCLQCVILGFAYEPWHLFVCAAFSLLGNLVYPSLSSLVSGSVEPSAVGEALGALNGIKALTEGIGPLVFGSLMTLSEKSELPGWPYLLAALLAYGAYTSSLELPDVQHDEYIHELELKETKRKQKEEQERNKSNAETKSHSALLWQWMMLPNPNSSTTTSTTARGLQPYSGDNEEEEDEYEGLLSEIEESEDEVVMVNRVTPGESRNNDMTQLPTTFASIMKQQRMS